MPEQKTPRLSELKRVLRWLKKQYQRRADEAASTPRPHDRAYPEGEDKEGASLSKPVTLTRSKTAPPGIRPGGQCTDWNDQRSLPYSLPS